MLCFLDSTRPALAQMEANAQMQRWQGRDNIYSIEGMEDNVNVRHNAGLSTA